MAYPEKRPFTDIHLNAYLADVSAASSAFVAVPAQGELVGFQSALYGAITSADSVITIKVNGTAVTGGTITVSYSGSAAGDVDQNFEFTAVPVKRGDVIEFATDGASSTTAAAMLTAVISGL